MYDPTFGPTSLDRHIRKSDFKDFPDLTITAVREAAIDVAVGLAKNGLAGMVLQKNNLAGRTIYNLKDLPTELVLRKAAQNLRKITYAKQSNRLEIVRRLRLLCMEGLPFCIAKFDVRQFYPSVDQTALKEMLNRRLATAPSTRVVLMGLIDRCIAQGISGIPPGLGISAALAEMYMQDFDTSIRIELKTHLYARYVDDIIMVLPPTDNRKILRRKVVQLLPEGLALNEKKTDLLSFEAYSKKVPNTEHRFDYLGFSFDVSEIGKDRPYRRDVKLDIALSKVRKCKTRIIRSLLQFLKDQNFLDLRDRFRLISSNYKFYDKKKSRVRSAGMFHTYGLIDIPSGALNELDAFKSKVLLSNTGKISAHLSLSLTNVQKTELLGSTFSSSFANKTHFHFSPDRLKHLMECWKYV